MAYREHEHVTDYCTATGTQGSRDKLLCSMAMSQTLSLGAEWGLVTPG